MQNVPEDRARKDARSRELVSFSRGAERPRGPERNEDFGFLPEECHCGFNKSGSSEVKTRKLELLN